MSILLILAIVGALISIAFSVTSRLRPALRLLTTMSMVGLLSTQVWIFSARLGPIGDPATLDRAKEYRIVALTSTQDAVVILMDERGALNSYRFKGPIILVVGSLCRVQDRPDFSWTLVKD